MEAIGSELNLFEPSLFQSAVVGESDQEFGPLATITPGAPIDFQIEASGNNYIDLNNSKLEVRVKLVTPTDADIANTVRAGVVNLPLHSLFATVTIKIANKVVTETNNLYPYRAYLETLLNYPKEVVDTRMLTEGFVMDTAGEMNVTNPAGANTGLGAREAEFNASAVVRLIGRLHSDLWHQEKLIPPGIKMDIQLVPNRAAFVIKTTAAADPAAQVAYKFQIRSARFIMKFKEVSPSMRIAHLKMLQERNYQIPHTKVLMKTHNIPDGVTSYVIPNMFKGRLPDRVVLAMVSDAAVNGQYTSNPFNFQHFNLNYMVLHVNSQMLPRIPLEPNFTTNDYKREYLTVMEAMGYDIGPSSWTLTPYQWSHGYNIYVFKITPGIIGAVRSPQINGDIKLEVKFSVATTANITLLVLSEEPGLLEIDKFDNTLI